MSAPLNTSLMRTLSDLSERLNLSRDEGEKWIVNLIRETRMGADAKIDLEKACLLIHHLWNTPSDQFSFFQNVIEINRPPLPIYQTVIEKTRGLALRTQALGAAVARTGQQGSIAKNEAQAPAVAAN